MSSSKPHCGLFYHEFNGADLDTFAHLVAEGIYTNNPPFTAPPLTQLAFNALVDAFHEKYEAYKNGGKAQKGAYTIARTNLIKALDDTADYVDALPAVDDGMIQLAGYTPTKTGDTSAVPPPTPTDVKLSHGASGEIKAECGAITGSITYGCLIIAEKPLPDGFAITNAGQIIISENKPTPPIPPIPPQQNDEGSLIILDLTKSRKKRFTGLVKGTEYFFYFYAINSAGVSQLSEMKSMVCG